MPICLTSHQWLTQTRDLLAGAEADFLDETDDALSAIHEALGVAGGSFLHLVERLVHEAQVKRLIDTRLAMARAFSQPGGVA